uniref:RNA binding protein, putative n=1 Tax=Neospora caninum (strain Liverpool) TaxID=572307 RepID=F0JB94_NEOCL|nr:RNA binding protein, putative [Neospora caninum Liverpool]CEL71361.1 TPA: RNA binding protein, putative [Neospora caninum Liverpool]
MTDLKNLSSEKKLDMSLDELIAQTNATKGPQRRNAGNSQQQGRRTFHGSSQRQGPYSRAFGSNYRDAVGRDYLLEGSGAQGGYKAGGAAGSGPRPGVTPFVPHVYTVKVKNLPLDVPERELENLLRRHFGNCGNVVRIIFRQKNPGEAYIGFNESSSCSKALAELQGSKLKGRVLTIEKGQPTGPAPPRGQADFVRRGPVGARLGAGVAPAGGVVPLQAGPYGGNYVATTVHPNYVRGGPPSGLLGHCPPTLAYVPARAGADVGPPFSNGGAGAEWYADSRSGVAPGASPVAYGGSHGASLVGKQAPAQSGTTIIISNVPCDLTAQELQDAFSVVGAVLRTELLLNASGAPTGRVALTFESRHAALEAVRRFDGGDLNAHTIRVFLE